MNCSKQHNVRMHAHGGKMNEEISFTIKRNRKLLNIYIAARSSDRCDEFITFGDVRRPRPGDCGGGRREGEGGGRKKKKGGWRLQSCSIGWRMHGGPVPACLRRLQAPRREVSSSPH